jgi:hypothetical protein
MVSLELFIDISLPFALWPWSDSASNRNEYREYFLELKVTSAYVSQPCHLHVPIVLKSERLNLLEPSGPVEACNGIALPYLNEWINKRVPFHKVHTIGNLVVRILSNKTLQLWTVSSQITNTETYKCQINVSVGVQFTAVTNLLSQQ